MCRGTVVPEAHGARAEQYVCWAKAVSEAQYAGAEERLWCTALRHEAQAQCT